LARIEKSIEIKAPIEKVWAFLTDFEKYPSFMKGVKKIEYLTEKHSGIGVKTHWVMESSGQEIEWDGECAEWVENKKMSWHSTSGMKFSGHQLIEPTETGTKLTLMMDYELPYSILGKIIDKLKVEKDFVKQIEESLKSGKIILES
jgi:uncharacterized membrane protein